MACSILDWLSSRNSYIDPKRCNRLIWAEGRLIDLKIWAMLIWCYEPVQTENAVYAFIAHAKCVIFMQSII